MMYTTSPSPARSGNLDLSLAGAFVRGRLASAAGLPDAAAVHLGLDSGLRLHRFTLTPGFPRVRRVLQTLRGLEPATLLDVGSGRGAFLWPLLRAFPLLPVVAIDVDRRRAADLHSVARGGVGTLSVLPCDMRALPFHDGAFDGVCALEVLEHLGDPEPAFRELLRVAARFVVVSAPSRQYTASELEARFLAAGARRVTCDHVFNHVIAVAHR